MRIVLRIVGGRLGGRRIRSPRGRGTRPTSERVREAIASALEARGWIENAVVLELFAGTGAMSFEAISRGAARAVLVERDPELARSIMESARELDVAGQVEVVTADLRKSSALDRLPDASFDLLFADPPYARVTVLPELLRALWEQGKLRAGAALVLEHPARERPSLPEGFREVARYRYGDTAVILGTAPSEAS